MAQLLLPKRLHPDFILPGVKPKGPVVVNPYHPLGKGIVACWLFTEDADIFRDASGNQEDGVIGNATWAISNQGNRVLVTGDSAYATVANFQPPTVGSAIFKYKSTSLDGGNQRPFGSHDAFEMFQSDATGLLQSQLFQAGGDIISGTTTIDENVWYSVIATWNLSTNDSRIYIDGVLETIGTNADDNPGSATLTIGNRTGSADDNALKGEFEYLFIKDYVIEQGEACQWLVDPYQFLVPKFPISYFTPGIAAGSSPMPIFTNYYTQLLGGHE